MATKNKRRSRIKKPLKTLMLNPKPKKIYTTSVKMTGFMTAFEGDQNKILLKKLSEFDENIEALVTDDELEYWKWKRLVFDPRSAKGKWKTQTTERTLNYDCRRFLYLNLDMLK